MTKGSRAVTYARVSSHEQGESGLSLSDQQQALDRECKHRGWTLVGTFSDIASGKSTNGRRGLEDALSTLRRREADVLIVKRLDRLARSTLDFARLVDRSRREGWSIVALDVGIDMTTANGEMFAGLLAVLAQWESRLISERTRAAMAQLPRDRRNGHAVYPDNVRARVLALKGEGLSLRKIGAQLEAEGITTLSGKPWHPSTLAQIIEAG